jgi:hypothetical protein
MHAGKSSKTLTELQRKFWFLCNDMMGALVQMKNWAS